MKPASRRLQRVLDCSIAADKLVLVPPRYRYALGYGWGADDAISDARDSVEEFLRWLAAGGATDRDFSAAPIAVYKAQQGRVRKRSSRKWR